MFRVAHLLCSGSLLQNSSNPQAPFFQKAAFKPKGGVLRRLMPPFLKCVLRPCGRIPGHFCKGGLLWSKGLYRELVLLDLTPIFPPMLDLPGGRHLHTHVWVFILKGGVMTQAACVHPPLRGLPCVALNGRAGREELARV